MTAKNYPSETKKSLAQPAFSGLNTGSKYLGYAFYRYKGECGFRVHSKSVKKMQNKIRELTKRSNGWGNDYRKEKLRQFITGWINYFKLADMKNLMLQIDEWLSQLMAACLLD